MRVISGKYRGRKLKGPGATGIRPTSDRLKETLFDILGPSVEGRAWLDVFGGTGSVGIEALSRGACQVVFIENTEAAHRLIQRNLEICGVKSGYQLIRQEVFAALRALARRQFQADIIFFDPPYDWKPYGDLLDIAFKKGLASPSCIVVVEHHRKAYLPESGNGYFRFRIVRQGDHCLSFYKAVK